MAKTNAATERGYSRVDLAAVADNPPLSDAELAAARPFAETFPELAKSITRGKQRAPTKELISIRLTSSTLAAFRALGPGWQTKVDEALAKAIGDLK